MGIKNSSLSEPSGICLRTTGLAKMTKFAYKNTCPSVSNYQSESITKCCWLSNSFDHTK